MDEQAWQVLISAFSAPSAFQEMDDHYGRQNAEAAEIAEEFERAAIMGREF